MNIKLALSSIFLLVFALNQPLMAASKLLPEKPPEMAVTFSGGGFHALGGAAGWMMGVMERTGQYDLAAVTKAAAVISSNSGGSWFTALAAYSPTFVSELESREGDAGFISERGYLGRVWQQLRTLRSGCDDWETGKKRVCDYLRKQMLLPQLDHSVLNSFLLSEDGEWQTTVEDSVFLKDYPDYGYYPELSVKTLSSPQQPWLADKDLLMATMLLTQGPALTYTSISRSQPELMINGVYHDVQVYVGSKQGAEKQVQPGGVPMMLSRGNSSLPGGDLKLSYGVWQNQGDEWGVSIPDNMPGWTMTSEQVRTAFSGLPVVNAAAMSSAALGAYVNVPVENQPGSAHPGFMLGAPRKDTAIGLNGSAPGYIIQQPNDEAAPVATYAGSLHQLTAGGTTQEITQKLQNMKAVRFSDGAFLDNTAAVQALRHLQDRNDGVIPDNFNIVVFDNFPQQQATSTMGTETVRFPTGTDIALLFGFDKCTEGGCALQTNGLISGEMMGMRYVGPSPQIFAPEGYFNTTGSGLQPRYDDKVFWSSRSDTRHPVQCRFDIPGKEPVIAELPLIYARYDDVTVDMNAPGSQLYGLNSTGARGVIHVFSALGAAAPMVPGFQAGYDCLTNMVQGIVTNVAAKNAACNPSEPYQSGKNECTLGDYLAAVLLPADK